MKYPITFINIESNFVRQCFMEAYLAFPLLHPHPLRVQGRSRFSYTMQAKPVINTAFFTPAQRHYQVLMSHQLDTPGADQLADLPREVLIGWFAHELGHIVDYLSLNTLGFIQYGLRYIWSDSFRQKVERQADLHAIAFGMSDFILATKRYILFEAGLPKTYINRIMRYYMTIEEVIEEAEKLGQQGTKQNST